MKKKCECESRKMLPGASFFAVFFAVILMFSVCSVRGTTDGSGRKLCFVFDDAYSNIETVVLNAFNNRGIDAGVAVSANLVNGTWESQDVMDWDQIQHLANHGWDVYSHGYDHLHLGWNNLTQTQITNEIVTSEEWIRGNVTGFEDIFVLPFAEGFDNATIRELYMANYFASRNTGVGVDYATEVNWFYPANVSLHGYYTGVPSMGNYIVAREIGATANQFNVTAIAVAEDTIDNFVTNSQDGAVLVLLFHQVHASFASVRDAYGDTTFDNITAILDYAQAYEDVGNFTITTLGSALSARHAAYQMDLLVPAMMSLAVIIGVVAAIKRKI